MTRSTSTLRDILFDEIEQVRGPNGDHRRALAVARLSQQIISTATVEMRFHKMRMAAEKEGQEMKLGSMDLGSRALPVADQTNAHPSDSTEQDAAQPPSMVGSDCVTVAS